MICRKKASVVNAGKQNLVSKQDERKSVDKNVVEKSILQKGSAVSEQNKKQVKSILFGEYSDLLLNYLSKAFGVHEHWKSLFETYEGDPYKAAKYALAVLLLCFRLCYMFNAFRRMKCCFVNYNLRHVVNFGKSWGSFFSPGTNHLYRKRTLFNLYFYNISLSVYILRALCPTVFIPHFVYLYFSVEDNAEITKLLNRLTDCKFELGMREYCVGNYDFLERGKSDEQLFDEIEDIKNQLNNKEVDVNLLMQYLDISVKKKILREGKEIIWTFEANKNENVGLSPKVTEEKAKQMVKDMTAALLNEGISGVDNI